MKYKDYYNFELGNRDIYSRNDILGMTVQDLFDNELPLSYQYNTIGIPKDDESVNSEEPLEIPSPIKTEIEKSTNPDNSKLEEPDYYEENLPVELDDELWTDLNEYIPQEQLGSIPPNDNDSMPKFDTESEQSQERLVNRDDSPLLKGYIEEFVNSSDLIQKDSTLSNEAKIAKIKEQTESRNKEIDKEHRKNMARILGGAAIELGSLAIPGTIGAKAVGGLTKIMAPIAKQLVPKVGKKIANAIVKNIAEDAVSAPVGAIGSAIANGEFDIATFGKDMKNNSEANALNLAYPFDEKLNQGNNLKKIEKIDNFSKAEKREIQEQYLDYYNNYVDGTVKHKRPKPRPSFQLRDKEWIEWLRKAGLRK